MQITVNANIVLHQPSTQVFTCLTDTGQWPQWGGNVVSMEQISAGSMHIGSKIRQVTVGGRESTVEVTEYVPGQRFGIKGPNMEGTFTLEPFKDGTRLSAQFEVEATGFIAWMYTLMLNQFVMNDLRRFRKMVESNAVAGLKAE
jgi:uncharacterized protein YndB with AHSA1/START domain